MKKTTKILMTIMTAACLAVSTNIFARGGVGGGGGGGVNNPPPPAGTLAVLQGRVAGDVSARAYGYSVALSGNTAVAAAPATNNGAGAVYVLQRSGTTWRTAVKLTRPTGQANGGFGTSVAISGDTIAIGNSPSVSTPSFVNVYQRTLGVWRHQAKISVAGSACLGRSLAINGNTIIAGDPCAFSTTTSGAAYAFVRNVVGASTTWIRQAKLTSSIVGNRIASSVSISGNTAVVSSTTNGAAIVYQRVGANWSKQATLTPAGLLFGYYGPSGTLSIDNNTVVVGMPTDSVLVAGRGLMAAAGAAYVFERRGATWAQKARLTRLNDARREHLFGISVSVSGNRAVIGMDEGVRGPGNPTVFQRIVGVWNTSGNAINPPTPVDGMKFGASVALDRNAFIAGAPFAGTIPLGQTFAPGAAYLFGLPAIP